MARCDAAMLKMVEKIELLAVGGGKRETVLFIENARSATFGDAKKELESRLGWKAERQILMAAGKKRHSGEIIAQVLKGKIQKGILKAKVMVRFDKTFHENDKEKVPPATTASEALQPSTDVATTVDVGEGICRVVVRRGKVTYRVAVEKENSCIADVKRSLESNGVARFTHMKLIGKGCIANDEDKVQDAAKYMLILTRVYHDLEEGAAYLKDALEKLVTAENELSKLVHRKKKNACSKTDAIIEIARLVDIISVIEQSLAGISVPAAASKDLEKARGIASKLSDRAERIRKYS